MDYDISLGLGHLFDETCKKYSNKDAMIYKNWHISYSDFIKYVNQTAHYLKHLSLNKGDVVGIISKNRPEYLICEFAMYKVGIIPLKLNWRLNYTDTLELSLFNNVKLFFIGEDIYSNNENLFKDGHNLIDVIPLRGSSIADSTLINLIKDMPDDEIYESFKEDSEAGRLCTSGTTGKPKTVSYMHTGIYKILESFYPVCGYKDDVKTMIIFQMFHSACIDFYQALLSGSTIYVISNFELESYMNLIKDEGINTLGLVPTVLNIILNEYQNFNVDIKQIKMIRYGAAIMPKSVAEKLLSVNPDVNIYNLYGMTEVGGVVSVLIPKDVNLNTLETVGKPIKNCIVKIVNSENKELPTNEIGEIIVKAPGIMKGYYKQKELTVEKIDKDNFYHTGDLGYLDNEGFLHLSGRMDDLIISGGENIYPAEIENVMIQFDEIKEVAIIGVPDEIWGQKIKAFVVLKDGIKITDKELISICRKEMPHYKCPKIIEFIKELPRNGTGKIDTKKLKEME